MATEKTTLPSLPSAMHDEVVSQHNKYRPTTVPGVPAYAEHGTLIDHERPQENVVKAAPDLAWSRVRKYLREPFSEFFGVFILVMFGDGVVAQVVLSNGEKGDYQSINWGWA
jgi:aquaglyceroporin related protein, other eukaryote